MVLTTKTKLSSMHFSGGLNQQLLVQACDSSTKIWLKNALSLLLCTHLLCGLLSALVVGERSCIWSIKNNRVCGGGARGEGRIGSKCMTRVHL